MIWNQIVNDNAIIKKNGFEKSQEEIIKNIKMDQRVTDALMNSYKARGAANLRLEDTEEQVNKTKEVRTELLTLLNDSSVSQEHAAIIIRELTEWLKHDSYLHDRRERHRRNRETISKKIDEFLATKPEEDYVVLERQPAQSGVSPDHVSRELDKFIEEKELNSLLPLSLQRKLMVEFAVKQILAHAESL